MAIPAIPSRARHSESVLRYKVFYPAVLVLLLFALMAVWSGTAHGAQVTLAWDPTTPTPDGYRLYWRTSSSQQYALLEDVGNSVSEDISNLQGGTTYYFAATAYDSQGNQSGFSNEVVYTAPQDCSYSITLASGTFGPEGGLGTFTVSTQDTCTWTASLAPWMTITSGTSGTGSGTVSYTVSANTDGVSRTAASTVAGQTFTVTQAGSGTYTLTTSRSGSGTGTVSTGSGNTTFTAGTTVTLTAIPNANSTFSGWSGACSGTSTTCQVTMNSNVSVSAGFTATAYSLTVTKSGTGAGTVTTTPSGTSFKPGKIVTLTARPSITSVFSGWSGACSGTRTTCRVKMTSDMNVEANFTRKTYTITALAGANGIIYPSGVVSVLGESSQSFTITPAEGYTIQCLRVNGRAVTGSGNSYTFSNIKAKHKISVSFKKQ